MMTFREVIVGTMRVRTKQKQKLCSEF